MPEILIFGGTTEGRRAVAVCESGGKPFFYSTKTRGQGIDSTGAVRLNGAMDGEQILAFCRENGIRLIVDAAHPFAEELRRNILRASRELEIPVVRYERRYPARDPRFLWFDTFDKAVQYLRKNRIDRLMALTGVGSIERLKSYWIDHDCRFRILNRPDSLEIAGASGFPEDHLFFYRPETTLAEAMADDEALFRALHPGAILTKESGDSGGFSEKALIAIRLNIPLLVVCRPGIDPSFIVVYGDHGLRREIQRWVPGFFPLRTGLTTGTCAAAAVTAALRALMRCRRLDSVFVALPDGEPIAVPVQDACKVQKAGWATVVKDAGDDPDVTDGLPVTAVVRWNGTPGKIDILAGEGVGTVTLPGLGLAVGDPAIGAVPRRMISRQIEGLLQEHHIDNGVSVSISIPGGETAAARTFNPKLGIVGGLSILGTSGIVQPFSAEAFLGAIRREMDVARALECRHLILNSGARSERIVRERFPEAPPQAFVHYGNHIGEALRMAAEAGFERLTLGIMIGKAVKLAEGAMDTHSRRSAMNTDFLQRLATEAGCSPVTVERIAGITLARELREIVPRGESAFFEALVEKCRENCAPLFRDGEGLEILLIEDPA
jgi:cobalt-precorrin-5B (C1)-methyltransferase